MEQTTLNDFQPNPFFGKPWDAPVTDDAQQVPTPVGSSCLHCSEEIVEGDRGFILTYWSSAGTELVSVHLECQLRQALGGVNHILGRCICCGGDEDPDPPGMTRRGAALAAVKAYEDKLGVKLIRDREE